MNKVLITALAIAALSLTACGGDKPEADKSAPAATASSPEGVEAAASAQADSAAAAPAKVIVAPAPPAPKGGQGSAPPLKPEDIARIQEMLKKQDAEKPAKGK